MRFLMDYNAMTKEGLLKQNRYKIMIVKDASELNQRCLRILADLIKEHNEKHKPTTAILPVGTLEYSRFAKIVGKEKISLKNLTIVMMDEYLGDDGNPITESHPCSFRGFMRQSLLNNLDPSLDFDEKRLFFPMPDNCDMLSEMLLGMDGADIVFGGFGITGHFAFNDPPESGKTNDPITYMRESKTRMLTISRESCTQMAIWAEFTVTGIFYRAEHAR